ncbi:anthrone oxygenase family protein [Planobispora takensis]|uniref:Membrane protein n=1 Tax=Planobispora takensis TaxID=1367882 RepID=A0A8J3WX05_9ACTN|nr:anthrone oxygenase family protein [Planobispora takensis]GII04750.1 membrane protein [Planobispora takensis]
MLLSPPPSETSGTPETPTPASRAAERARGWALASATTLMGLIAGFFYAYACSVMIGLARVGDRVFVDSMQWINATVRNVWFAPGFFGALVATAVAAVLHLGRAGRPVLPWVLAALVLYGAAFAVTMGVNVPLNDQLAAAGDPAAMADPGAVRAAYEGVWTAWNTTRTVASTVALACLVRALVLHGRHTARRER